MTNPNGSGGLLRKSPDIGIVLTNGRGPSPAETAAASVAVTDRAAKSTVPQNISAVATVALFVAIVGIPATALWHGIGAGVPVLGLGLGLLAYRQVKQTGQAGDGMAISAASVSTITLMVWTASVLMHH